MHPTTYLGLDEESKKEDNTQYRATSASLLYLIIPKPDIMFNACLCARFQKYPSKVHLTAIRRVFRYLIGTPNLGIYFKQRKEFRLINYCDTNYAGDKLERKNTRESFNFIGGNLVTWICKK